MLALLAKLTRRWILCQSIKDFKQNIFWTPEAYSFTQRRFRWKFFQFCLKSTGRAVLHHFHLSNFHNAIVKFYCAIGIYFYYLFKYSFLYRFISFDQNILKSFEKTKANGKKSAMVRWRGIGFFKNLKSIDTIRPKLTKEQTNFWMAQKRLARTLFSSLFPLENIS